MKIALIGYGKMGKVIERIALERGHHIVARIGSQNSHELETLTPQTTDVAIEFSSPEAAFANLEKLLTNKIPTVCGTTGWLDKAAEIEDLCRKAETAFFYASNFSIGVNIFFELNKQLARWMAPYPGYEVATYEIHHTQKKDAPSGTAITLAEGIQQANPAYKSWVNNQLAGQGEIPIWSAREGKVPGTHTIKYISEVDTVELTHIAHSREGFAHGAVVAAEWLQGRTGIFSMQDLLKIG